MTLVSFLVLVHAVAAVLGVGGATFAEVLYAKALKDGIVDPSEQTLLKTIYSLLRVGFIALLVSGVSFLLLYKANGEVEKLWGTVLWAKIFITGVIGVNAVLLQAHAIPFKIGSAISFVSWYTAFFLGTLRGTISTDILTIFLFYGCAVLIGIFVLEQARVLLLKIT